MARALGSSSQKIRLEMIGSTLVMDNIGSNIGRRSESVFKQLTHVLCCAPCWLPGMEITIWTREMNPVQAGKQYLSGCIPSISDWQRVSIPGCPAFISTISPGAFPDHLFMTQIAVHLFSSQIEMRLGHSPLLDINQWFRSAQSLNTSCLLMDFH